MKHNKYQKEPGSTSTFTKRMKKATKQIGQKYRKGGTKDCFLFDIQFYSKKPAEVAMEFFTKLIGMVNTNNKGFCKDNIEKLTKDWPGGSYLALSSKTMVPGYRPLITIE